MAAKNNNFTNKELLVRIDERQRNISHEISEIKSSIAEIKNILDNKVSRGEFEKLATEVKKNTSWRVYISGAIAIIAAIIGIFIDDLKNSILR